MAKQGTNHDGRLYVCPSCDLVKSIRYNSFAEEFKCTLMELTRLIFYYFARGYTIDAVHRELTHDKFTSLVHIKHSKQMVLGIYAFAREMISDRVIRDIKQSKLGGAGH